MKSIMQEEIAKIRYFQPSYEEGIIESVSSEGNKLFVIVRRPPKDDVDNNGNPIRVDGTLFGNEANLSEDEITITELKIPADVDLSQSIISPETYIGRRILVKMVAGHPSSCILREQDNLNPSIITKEQIYNARMKDPSRSLSSDASRNFLKKEYGLTSKQIDAISESTYGKIKPSGFRLTNAGTSAWDQQTEQDQKGSKDVSDTASISTNIPGTKLRTKTCYYHAKVFSGK